MTKVVNLARAWIGTPYVHQAAAKSAGTDCLGLIRGLWSELYGQDLPPVPAYTPDWSEARGEERLWQAAIEHLIPKDRQDAALGDILLFRMRRGAVAKHLGITASLGPAPTFIHAYSGRGVVESAFGPAWQARVVARFAFPETLSLKE